MVKRFSHILLSAVVIFSLFAPSIIPLMVDDTSQIVFVEITEEEKKDNQKQQNNSELEEKLVYFQELAAHESVIRGIQKARASHYLDGSNQFHPEILLPPPEHS